MVYKNISLNVSGALAEITLNRPKSLNALSGGLLVEMMHALGIVQNSKISEKSRLRLVILN